MSSIVIAGDTSGSVTLQAPAVAGSTVLNLPATSGTIQTSGAGYTTNGVAYASSTSALTTGSAFNYDGTNLTVSYAGAQGYEIRPNSGDYSGGINLLSYNRTTSAWSPMGQFASYFAWQTNASESMRLTSTGLGIGTSSPSVKLHVNGGGDIARFTNGTNNVYFAPDSTGVSIFSGAGQTGSGLYIKSSDNSLQFWTNSSNKATLDSSGNLAVGISSGYRTAASYTAFALNGTTGSLIDLYANSTRVGGIAAVSSAVTVSSITAIPLVFSTSDTERARIDSNGALLVGTTTASSSERLKVVCSAASQAVVFQNSNASNPYGLTVYFSGGAPNNTTEWFQYNYDTAGLKASIRSNGGIANYSANNVNISDSREKTNVNPASSYLDKICAIPVRTYNYIDQNLEEDDGLTLGVFAQDVQAVAPELVMESNWGTEEEPKMRLSIYQTDLQYALMKCIQEQQALINTLTERISVLENK